ncbi:MAG: nicotinate-nucleotide--dimethylbenzimidazole phosphoribosyltransferase, partial [Streptomyces sp.]|nr:nicotinate-nucleotide--dimethylbenzimidazole phosphoribosyltransferase [Streptomyces sp.]
MTDTGQIPGEGLPGNPVGEAVRQPHPDVPGNGVPQQSGWGTEPQAEQGAPAYYLDHPVAPGTGLDDEDEVLLMPGPQGSWSDPQPVPPQRYDVPSVPSSVPAPSPQSAPLAPVGLSAPAELPVPPVPPGLSGPSGPAALSAPESAEQQRLAAAEPVGPAPAPRRPLHMGPPIADAPSGGVSVRSLADRGPAVRVAGPPTTGPEYLDIPRDDTSAIPAQQTGEPGDAAAPTAGSAWPAAPASPAASQQSLIPHADSTVPSQHAPQAALQAFPTADGPQFAPQNGQFAPQNGQSGSGPLASAPVAAAPLPEQAAGPVAVAASAPAPVAVPAPAPVPAPMPLPEQAVGVVPAPREQAADSVAVPAVPVTVDGTGTPPAGVPVPGGFALPDPAVLGGTPPLGVPLPGNVVTVDTPAAGVPVPPVVVEQAPGVVAPPAGPVDNGIAEGFSAAAGAGTDAAADPAQGVPAQDQQPVAAAPAPVPAAASVGQGNTPAAPGELASGTATPPAGVAVVAPQALEEVDGSGNFLVRAPDFSPVSPAAPEAVAEPAGATVTPQVPEAVAEA